MSTETATPETQATPTPPDKMSFEGWKKFRNEGGGTEAPTEVPAEAPAEAPAEPEVEQTEVSEAETEPEPSSEPEAEQPKGEKRKGGFQKKIDKLTKERNEARERAEAQEQRLAALEQRLAPKPAENAQPTKPQRTNFVSEDDYLEAATAWNVEQTLAKREAVARLAEQQESWKQTTEAYDASAIEFEVDHPDWKETINQDLPISEALKTAIIKMKKDGPRVAYHLGKNPELCHELAAMDPYDAVMEIGHIRKTLAPRSETPPRSTDGKFVSKAAAPITPVGTTGTKSTLPPEKMSHDQYRKWRESGGGRN